MAEKSEAGSATQGGSYSRIDPVALEEIRQRERPILGIRWWVLPLALFFCVAQSVLCLYFEFYGPVHLVATQISIFAFTILFLFALAVNPLLRWTRLVAPMNRAEVMAFFAALFVSGGISSFGLIDMLVPMLAAPFTPEWNTPQSGRLTHLVPFLNKSLYLSDPDLIQQYRVGFGDEAGYWHKIPWVAWLKPFGLWMIFVLAMYAMFYAIAMLFFESWSRREKLVFPLARLPEAVVCDEGAPSGSIPSTLKSRLFWLGFLGAFLFLGYNGICQAGWLRGMEPLYLGIRGAQLKEMLSQSVFNGIADGGFGLALRFNFTCIGIAFLLPIAVSLSIWAYEVIALLMVLGGMWMAFYASARVVRSGQHLESSFPSCLGGGALFGIALAMVFGLIWEKWQASARDGGAGADRAVRFLRALGWGAAALALSMGVTVLWLKFSGVAFVWGSLYTGAIFLMSVGLIRVLAESGLFCQQVHTGPMHLMGITPGTVVPGASLAPMMQAHSSLFFDMKCFIGPSIMNSFKMEEETRAQRWKFHGIVIAGILVTVAAGFVTLLYLVYGLGANRSINWFFTSGPNAFLNGTTRLIADGGETPWLWWFFALGAGWAVLSLLMRQKFFWWLHPIGLVMLMNPLTRAYWLSFFVGWLCKKAAVSYGGRHTFARLRPLFIGLIFGELLACFVWALLKFSLKLDYVLIDINLNQ